MLHIGNARASWFLAAWKFPPKRLKSRGGLESAGNGENGSKGKHMPRPRRSVAVLAALMMGWGLVGWGSSTTPAKADPAVQGIAIAGVAALLWGLYENPPQLDAEREFIVQGVGLFDAVDNVNRAILFTTEYWAPVTFFRFRPFGGLIGTTDKAIGGYVGLRYDVNFGKYLVISPNVALMGLASGDGKNLGASAVLRSGIEVGFRFDNGVRISGAFHHMSHGKLLSDRNPGTETAIFSIAIPTDALFGGQLLKGRTYWRNPFGLYDR